MIKDKLNKGGIILACMGFVMASYTVSASDNILEQPNFYEVRTLTGNVVPDYLDGDLKNAKYNTPTAITMLRDGKLLVSDTDNQMLRLIDGATVSTYSGNLFEIQDAHNAGAYQDGDKKNAFFNTPLGIAQDSKGNVFVADSQNHAIRKIAIDGSVTTFAGNGIFGNQDGLGQEAQFNTPSDIVIDQNDNLYIADSLNHTIRKITPNGEVTTLNQPSTRIIEYFSGAIAESGDYKDGKLAEALFNEPSSLALDAKGNLYVSDTGNQRIRYIDFDTQMVSTLAGGGELSENELYVKAGYVDGNALEAKFANPLGINVTSDGSLLIADANNHVIRVYHDGEVKTLVGQPKAEGKSDGLLSTATFNQPSDVLERKDGSVVIVDSSNNKLRIIDRYMAEAHIEDGKIHVFVNGKLVKSEVDSILIKGTTYVPIRAFADSLGYTVEYDEKTKFASFVINKDFKYVFSVNSTSIVKQTAQGKQSLEVTSYLLNNRLYVPVRFISEELGFDVEWDKDLKHVVIRSSIFE